MKLDTHILRDSVRSLKDTKSVCDTQKVNGKEEAEELLFFSVFVGDQTKMVVQESAP